MLRKKILASLAAIATCVACLACASPAMANHLNDLYEEYMPKKSSIELRDEWDAAKKAYRDAAYDHNKSKTEDEKEKIDIDTLSDKVKIARASYESALDYEEIQRNESSKSIDEVRRDKMRALGLYLQNIEPGMYRILGRYAHRCEYEVDAATKEKLMPSLLRMKQDYVTKEYLNHAMTLIADVASLDYYDRKALRDIEQQEDTPENRIKKVELASGHVYRLLSSIDIATPAFGGFVNVANNAYEKTTPEYRQALISIRQLKDRREQLEYEHRELEDLLGTMESAYEAMQNGNGSPDDPIFDRANDEIVNKQFRYTDAYAIVFKDLSHPDNDSVADDYYDENNDSDTTSDETSEDSDTTSDETSDETSDDSDTTSDDSDISDDDYVSDVDYDSIDSDDYGDLLSSDDYGVSDYSGDYDSDDSDVSTDFDVDYDSIDSDDYGVSDYSGDYDFDNSDVSVESDSSSNFDMSDILDGASDFANGMGQFLNDVSHGVSDTVQNTFNGLKDSLGETVNNLGQGIQDFASSFNNGSDSDNSDSQKDDNQNVSGMLPTYDNATTTEENNNKNQTSDNNYDVKVNESDNYEVKVPQFFDGKRLGETNSLLDLMH